MSLNSSPISPEASKLNAGADGSNRLLQRNILRKALLSIYKQLFFAKTAVLCSSAFITDPLLDQELPSLSFPQPQNSLVSSPCREASTAEGNKRSLKGQRTALWEHPKLHYMSDCNQSGTGLAKTLRTEACHVPLQLPQKHRTRDWALQGREKETKQGRSSSHKRWSMIREGRRVNSVRGLETEKAFEWIPKRPPLIPYERHWMPYCLAEEDKRL